MTIKKIQIHQKLLDVIIYTRGSDGFHKYGNVFHLYNVKIVSKIGYFHIKFSNPRSYWRNVITREPFDIILEMFRSKINEENS